MPVARRAAVLVAGALQPRSHLLFDQFLDQRADPAPDPAINRTNVGFPGKNGGRHRPPNAVLIPGGPRPVWLRWASCVANGRDYTIVFPTTSATAPWGDD